MPRNQWGENTSGECTGWDGMTSTERNREWVRDNADRGYNPIGDGVDATPAEIAQWKYETEQERLRRRKELELEERLEKMQKEIDNMELKRINDLKLQQEALLKKERELAKKERLLTAKTNYLSTSYTGTNNVKTDNYNCKFCGFCEYKDEEFKMCKLTEDKLVGYYRGMELIFARSPKCIDKYGLKELW